jgi:hypothetical protein
MNINKPKRLNLKGWAELEGIRKKIKQGAERGVYLDSADAIIEFIRKCGVRGRMEKKPWFNTIGLFMESQRQNLPRVNFPMLSSESSDEQLPWDYIGRDWYWWVNLFASNYGWSENIIEVLDVDDAIGLYQEILVQEQMQREWEHGHSEMSYSYDKGTKESKYVPLERPKWMQVTKDNYKSKPIKTVTIRKDMLPVGNVVNLDEE